MSEGRKRSRKSKLEVRPDLESDDNENTVLQAAQKLPKLMQPKRKMSDHTYSRQSIPTPPSAMQLSIKVEVEEFDEMAIMNTSPNLEHRNTPAATGCNAAPRICNVDLDKIFKVSDHIVWSSTNPADKFLGVELKNCWGKILRTNDDEDPYNKLLQKALLQWSNSVLNTRGIKGQPLLYQCRLCDVAWWNLYPFQQHLKEHDYRNIKLYSYERYNDTIIYASSNTMTFKFIPVEGNCSQCGENSDFHQVETYKICAHCSEVIPTCFLFKNHMATCRMKMKKNIVKKPSFCNVCSMIVDNQKDLLEHKGLIHQVRSDFPMPCVLKTCVHCQKEYTHFHTHPCSKSYMSAGCVNCYRVFPSKLLSVFHMQFGKHNHPCSICNDILPMNCMETEHMLTHTDKYVMAYHCVNAKCSPTTLFPDYKTLKLHKLFQHKQKFDKRRSYFDKVIVPKQCLRFKFVDPWDMKSEKSRKPSSVSEIDSENSQSESQPDGQCFDNFIVKQEMESLMDMGNEQGQASMTYEQMLSNIMFRTNSVHEHVEDVHENVEDVHENVVDVHENVEDVHENVEDVHEYVGGVHENVGGVQENVGDVHEYAGDVDEHEDPVQEHQIKIKEEPLNDYPDIDIDGNMSRIDIEENITKAEPFDFKTEPEYDIDNDLYTTVEIDSCLLSAVKQEMAVYGDDSYELTDEDDSLLTPVKDENKSIVKNDSEESIVKNDSKETVVKTDRPKRITRNNSKRMKTQIDMPTIKVDQLQNTDLLTNVKIEKVERPDMVEATYLQIVGKSENSTINNMKTEIDIIPRFIANKKRTYTCNLCGYTNIYKLYRLHKLSKCSVKPLFDDTKYTCTKCNSSYNSIKKYLKHFVKHNYACMTCPICGTGFDTMIRFISHFHSHVRQSFINYYSFDKPDVLPTRQYSCKTCHQIVSSPDRFFIHWEIHLELQHKNSAQQTPPKDTVKTTPTSSNKTLQPDVLDSALCQLLSQAREKECVICNRMFARRHDCKRHIIEHLLLDAYSKKGQTAEFSLRCQHCGMSSTRAEQYKFHMREHGGFPVYRCNLCDKTFSDSSNFAKHKKIHGIRVLVCDICNKKFHAKTSLEKHMTLHLTTKPVKCKICSRQFFTKSQYTKHEKTAHRAYSFKCVLCDLTFKSLREKWDHAWLQHGERKHIADCPICQQSYRKYQEVKNHAKKEHNADLKMYKVCDDNGLPTKTMYKIKYLDTDTLMYTEPM